MQTMVILADVYYEKYNNDKTSDDDDLNYRHFQYFLNAIVIILNNIQNE